MSQVSPEVHMVARAAHGEQTRETAYSEPLELELLLLEPPPGLLSEAIEPPGPENDAYGLPGAVRDQNPGPTRRSRSRHEQTREKNKPYFVENTGLDSLKMVGPSSILQVEPMSTTRTAGYEPGLDSSGATANIELPALPSGVQLSPDTIVLEYGEPYVDPVVNEPVHRHGEFTASSLENPLLQLQPVVFDLFSPVGEVPSSSNEPAGNWTAVAGHIEDLQATASDQIRRERLQQIYVPQQGLPLPATHLFQLETLLLENLVETSPDSNKTSTESPEVVHIEATQLPDYVENEEDEVPYPTVEQLQAIKRQLQTPPTDQRISNKRRNKGVLAGYIDDQMQDTSSDDSSSVGRRLQVDFHLGDTSMLPPSIQNSPARPEYEEDVHRDSPSTNTTPPPVYTPEDEWVTLGMMLEHTRPLMESVHDLGREAMLLQNQCNGLRTCMSQLKDFEIQQLLNNLQAQILLLLHQEILPQHKALVLQ